MLLDNETQVPKLPETEIRNCNKTETDSRQKWGCFWQPWFTLGGYFKSPFTKFRAVFQQSSRVKRGPRYHLQGNEVLSQSPVEEARVENGPYDVVAPVPQISDLRFGNSTSGKAIQEKNGPEDSCKCSRSTDPKPQRKRRVRFAEPLPSISGSDYVRERRRFLRSQLRNYRRENKRGKHQDRLELCILVRHP